MLNRPILIAARAALLSVLFALTFTGGAIASPEAPDDRPLTGTAWSTDLDEDGSTGLNDVAIFVCAYLGGGCPSQCDYTICHTGPPFCDPNCPPIFPPCDCGSGVPSYKALFTCDGVVGLNDFVIMSRGYTEATVTGKCE